MLNRPTAAQSAANIEELSIMPGDAIMTDCIERVRRGFRYGQAPSLTSDGTSGTYFLRDSTNSVAAVFKPVDEEPFAPNNPRGMRGSFGSDTCRPGVKSGEQAAREVIAYMLDHGSFADVPATALVCATHTAFERESDLRPFFTDAQSLNQGQNLNWTKSETEKFKSPETAQAWANFDTSSESTCPSEH